MMFLQKEISFNFKIHNQFLSLTSYQDLYLSKYRREIWENKQKKKSFPFCCFDLDKLKLLLRYQYKTIQEVAAIFITNIFLCMLTMLIYHKPYID